MLMLKIFCGIGQVGERPNNLLNCGHCNQQPFFFA